MLHTSLFGVLKCDKLCTPKVTFLLWRQSSHRLDALRYSLSIRSGPGQVEHRSFGPGRRCGWAGCLTRGRYKHPRALKKHLWCFDYYLPSSTIIIFHNWLKTHFCPISTIRIMFELYGTANSPTRRLLLLPPLAGNLHCGAVSLTGRLSWLSAVRPGQVGHCSTFRPDGRTADTDVIKSVVCFGCL